MVARPRVLKEVLKKLLEQEQEEVLKKLLEQEQEEEGRTLRRPPSPRACGGRDGWADSQGLFFIARFVFSDVYPTYVRVRATPRNGRVRYLTKVCIFSVHHAQCTHL
eukprot:COSAG05_NODE_1062_length_5993_cov_8.045640_7_plen_107_part_00